MSHRAPENIAARNEVHFTLTRDKKETMLSLYFLKMEFKSSSQNSSKKIRNSRFSLRWWIEMTASITIAFWAIVRPSFVKKPPPQKKNKNYADKIYLKYSRNAILRERENTKKRKKLVRNRGKTSILILSSWHAILLRVWFGAILGSILDDTPEWRVCRPRGRQTHSVWAQCNDERYYYDFNLRVARETKKDRQACRHFSRKQKSSSQK